MKKKVISVLMSVSMIIGIISANAVSITFDEIIDEQETNNSNIYYEDLEIETETTNNETEIPIIENANINFEEIKTSPEATNNEIIETNINTNDLKPALLSASTNQNVKVSVTNKPVVDIMLASKETNLNLETFESDIRTAIRNLGVDDSLFNFVTIEREYTSTEQNPADEILGNWNSILILNKTYEGTGAYQTNENNGMIASPNHFIVNNNLNAVVSNYNTYDDPNIKSVEPAACYYNPNGFQTKDAIFRFTYGIDPNNYGSFAHGEAGFIFKMQDPLNYYVYIMDNHSACGNVRYDYKELLVKVTNGYYSVIATNNFPAFSTSLKQDIRIETKGNNIKVFRNNTLIFNHNDSKNDFKNGSYGFYVFIQKGAYFANISIETDKIKTYEEVLREPTWRQEAHHIVVNVDDKEDNSLTGSDTEGEILSRTMNDKIHFIQWGTNTNKTETTEFINRNDDKGVFIDNSNYNNCVNETALYIKNLIDQTRDSQYVIVGQKTNIDVIPAELKQNAVSEDYPNGRWFIHHDYEYFDNNTGLSTQSEFYTPNLLCEFDKPGKYEIYFDDQLVKEIYAHRKPVAEFSLNVSGTNVTMNSESYDLDSNENIGYGNGIASENWYYKEPSESTWHSGKLTSIDVNKTYIVKLEVTDKQGESDYITKYVGSGIPVAAFNYVSDTISKYNPLNVRNTSYDPKGLSITNQEWVLKKNGTTVGTYSSPLTDFSSLGTGNYTYTLTVTNSDGIKSESYTKAFNVVDDNTVPSVIINPTSCEWKTGSQEVSVLFSDGESGFSKWRYAISNSQDKSTSGWSEYKTTSTDSVSITNTGIQYLHIEALDNSGNLLSRTVGTYKIDNVKPVINSIPVTVGNNSATVKANAVDSDSGIDSYTLTGPSFNKTQKTDTFTVNLPGIYTLTVTDEVGNSISQNVEVNVYYLIHITWNDSTIPDNLKPTTVVLQAKIGDSVIKEVELPFRTEDYTFKDLPINSGYKFDLIVSDRYGIEVENQNITATYQKSNFSVTIPKKITLNGNTGKASYTVSVNGTFYYNDTLTVKPNNSFILTDRNNISRMTGTVIQSKTGFTKSDNVKTGTSTKGNISVNRTLFSGLWKGSFNFDIKFVRNN